MTLTLLLSRSRHPRIALTMLSRLPRTIGMSFAMRIIQPITGILNIVSFDSHFISQGKWLMRKMSAYDS